MIPVYLYQNESALPESGTYFLVSGNGMWLHKDTDTFKAFVPVERISVLEDLNIDSFVTYSLPKIPKESVWQIKQFFKEVVRIHKSEASVNLYYNKKLQQFKIHVPKQFVSYSSVVYKREAFTHIQGLEDFLCVGTIHSHCDFDAFHSGTDVKDEEDVDGLHCTFGHNNLDEFSISATIAVNGHRFEIDPNKALDGINHISKNKFSLVQFPLETQNELNKEIQNWMKQVSSKNSQEDFEVGDIVEWSGESTLLRGHYGNGPCCVEHVGDNILMLKTPDGSTRIGKCLVKRKT